eukprot:TRINITY_DN24421_c0_g3_i2.p1 TRINITY_DN24421_c0_g3~~TRINITY_DN24421_c0_g3_i2.p1  ORF type:complete len:1241 (+),score=135.13 TRINITY_DN24421_c0_g3_i2:81-3803(+)
MRPTAGLPSAGAAALLLLAEVGSTCPAGEWAMPITVPIVDTRCAWFSTGQHNFAAAQSVCQNRGMNLVTVDSSTQLTQLRSAYNSHDGTTQFWIGLNDIANEASTDGTHPGWVWVETGNTNPGYRNWRSGQPNEQSGSSYEDQDCVISEGQGYADKDCNDNFRYVCAAPTITVTPTATPSTAYPSDSPTTAWPSAEPTISPSTAPPTAAPTAIPTTGFPSESPTQSPTSAPVTASPSSSPSRGPSFRPTVSPSRSPSASPTVMPTKYPTNQPTKYPTASPTPSPLGPTDSPTRGPSRGPSHQPTVHPSQSPEDPTESPSTSPSPSPTLPPSTEPSGAPTRSPSLAPSSAPIPPSAIPSAPPSPVPTQAPSEAPSVPPTQTPTRTPSSSPSWLPSGTPTSVPSRSPTVSPSKLPSNSPTLTPSRAPSSSPSELPSSPPTSAPSRAPTVPPSNLPSNSPTSIPTRLPSGHPTQRPSAPPSKAPSRAPSRSPTSEPTSRPTRTPSKAPSAPPNPAPTRAPSLSPTVAPSDVPASPSAAPVTPSGSPSNAPSPQPSDAPSTSPLPRPSQQPSAVPSRRAVTQAPAAALPPTVPPSTVPSAPPAEATATIILEPPIRPTAQPGLAEPPTQAPTLTFTQAVQPLESNQAVSEAAVTGAGVAAGIAALFSGSPAAAAQGPKMARFFDYSTCPPDDHSELGFMANPTGAGKRSRGGSTQYDDAAEKQAERKGAMLANFGVVGGCVAFNALCGIALLGAQRACGVSATVREAFATMRFPSFSLFPVLFMLQNILEPALNLIYYDPVTGHKMLALLMVVVMTCLPCCIAWITSRNHFQAQYKADLAMVNASRCPVFLWGDHKWISAPKDLTFERRYALIFKDFREKHKRFLLADIAVVTVISAVSAFVAKNAVHCTVQILLASLVEVLYIAAVQKLKPFIADLDHWYTITLTLCQVAAILLALIAMHKDHDQGLQTASAGLLIFGTLLMLVKSVFDLYTFVRDRLAERRAEAADDLRSSGILKVTELGPPSEDGDSEYRGALEILPGSSLSAMPRMNSSGTTERSPREERPRAAQVFPPRSLGRHGSSAAAAAGNGGSPSARQRASTVRSFRKRQSMRVLRLKSKQSTLLAGAEDDPASPVSPASPLALEQREPRSATPTISAPIIPTLDRNAQRRRSSGTHGVPNPSPTGRGRRMTRIQVPTDAAPRRSSLVSPTTPQATERPSALMAAELSPRGRARRVRTKGHHDPT